MKVQSDFYPEVSLQRWTTPLTGKSFFYLLRILHTFDSIHFFFRPGYKRTNDAIYVLTIPRYSPFRVIDDTFGDACMRKYFRDNEENKKKRRLRPSYTWKMWGTPFIKDLDQGDALFWWKKYRSSIYSHVIITDDEWIEFLSHKVKWKVHHKKSLLQLLKYYWSR